jgi:hypothetical protein
MNQLLQGLTNNVLALGLGVFAIGLGFFSLIYLNKRRKMLHRERMASLIKGLHYAGVAGEIFGKPKSDIRDHLLRGLRWILGGLGLAGALCGYSMMQPGGTAVEAGRNALAAAVPTSIGLAHLIYYWMSGKQKTPAAVRVAYRPGMYYRPTYRPGQRA